ncbi:MAG: family 10 glycosylhydrolase [Oscillospiraceae bacterium]|nr:family 10 glycosylhydrolase [Oscillospiraceae bacterium]
MRLLICVTVWILLLTACTDGNRQKEPAAAVPGGQTLQQLHLNESGGAARIVGVWVPYFICDKLFSSGEADTARETVRQYLSEMQNFGVNTVFLHVCAFGESTYPSANYPMTPTAHGIDEIAVFQEICGELDLSLHLWINPLRLQTREYMEAQRGDAVLTQWYRDSALKAANLSEWEGRYYLNPAAKTTRDFLTDVLRELIERYRPDGIHIDDYFYPTDAPAFDAEEFRRSGEADLAQWRRENITALVRQMYAAAHEDAGERVFSISPQGNLLMNYDTLFADVEEWSRAGDCCDLLIPQIYFGYLNEMCPFAETAEEWISMPRAEHVGLAVGLAAYKVGAEDPFAGDGQDEWIRYPGILARQAGEMLREPALCGICFYHSDSLAELSAQERDAVIRSVLEQ